MGRSALLLSLASFTALALVAGCRRFSTQPAQPAQPQQQAGYPPGGYYHPPPPPGYYPPAPPPGPTYVPPPAPAPQPAPAPAPAPQPQPPAVSWPTDWVNLLGGLLNGGAPAPAPAPQPQPQPQPQPAPGIPAIGARALELANALNAYRAQNGLPAIPVSRSLSYVADTHVRDLRDSPKVGSACNGHSWTSKGPWTACCYTADHAQARCMWEKPVEIAKFNATGFEITIGQPGENSGVVLDSGKAVAAWQGSSLHNDVILNRGQWQSHTWRSMGAGIVDSHACAWFSDQADPVQ